MGQQKQHDVLTGASREYTSIRMIQVCSPYHRIHDAIMCHRHKGKEVCSCIQCTRQFPTFEHERQHTHSTGRYSGRNYPWNYILQYKENKFGITNMANQSSM